MPAARIVHLTPIHEPFETPIFFEADGAAAGVDVMVVARNAADEQREENNCARCTESAQPPQADHPDELSMYASRPRGPGPAAQARLQPPVAARADYRFLCRALDRRTRALSRYLKLSGKRADQVFRAHGGQPVDRLVCSHFPAWRDLVEGNAFGLCVDPEDQAAAGSRSIPRRHRRWASVAEE